MNAEILTSVRESLFSVPGERAHCGTPLFRAPSPELEESTAARLGLRGGLRATKRSLPRRRKGRADSGSSCAARCGPAHAEQDRGS